MGTSPRLPQRGWLGLAFDDGDLVRRWAVLDNGVLWVHRENAEQQAAEQVIPLHDAEVQFPPPAPEKPEDGLDMHIVFGTGGKRLRLRLASEEEYRRWTAAMLLSAQLWHTRRQMAFMAVLPGVILPAAAPSAPSGPSSVEEGRKCVLQRLSHFLVQMGELRTRTRRAVTRAPRTPPEQTDDTDAADANASLSLPRFLRRAIADAVEKMWRAGGRAFACADVLGDADGDPLAVYDAVLVLREAVGAFVTYCSLLRDLQAMLRDGEGDDDPVPLSPLQCLLLLRDSLDGLGALIRRPEEEARQRAALSAVDATLQSCWMELSKRPLEQDVDDKAPGGREAAATASWGAHGCDGRPGASKTRSPPCALALPKGSSRLAARLRRDVVRTSVRRARKRARTEGQALLPDQALDDPAFPTSSVAGDASGEVPVEEVPPTPRVMVAMPLPVSAPAAQRMCRGVGGGSVYALNACAAAAPRRLCQDPGLLRRRRLVCSAADYDKEFDVVEGNQDSDDDEVAGWRATNGSADEDKASRQVQKQEGDLDLLDVPVTPATPHGGGRRALWCETAEVQLSGLLDRLNTTECVTQEAKFEVLSSEESYLRALDMLAHRVQAIHALQDPCVISDQDRDSVTKFLDTARACSMRFASALRGLWSTDAMLRGLCSLMHKEAMTGASLQQYVSIVSMQPRAASVLSKIGSLEANQLIPLLSLPAQRVTRLPLLLAAILRRLDQRTSDAVICRAALDRLNQIVFECNEALRRAEQTERLAEFGRILMEEKSSRKLSWNERKNYVIGRAKSFFLKSNRRIGSKTSKILTSTSSMLHLT